MFPSVIEEYQKLNQMATEEDSSLDERSDIEDTPAAEVRAENQHLELHQKVCRISF